MTLEEKVQKFKDWQFACSAYQMALSVIGVDKMTIAPRGGDAYRDERIAYLSGELYSLRTDPEMLEILKELKDETSIDYPIQRQCKLYYESAMKELVIPKDEFVAFNKLANESYGAWLEAKGKSDYSLFEPYLKKIIEAKKKMYSYRQSDEVLYNQMLDDFEPGMNMEKYDVFFNAVKERLVPLIQKVQAAPQIKDDFLYEHYDVESQKKFMDDLLVYLHFDKDWGYQNETEHPFTSWVCENDCRITTKYLENDVISAIFSSIHEAGHATYEHQCSPICDGNILSEGISSGMHESQSRFCENYLGRTKAFWTTNYPKLQKTFPEQLGNVTLDEFVNAVNVAKPGFIRTEADELTYPLHIYIRYEIEKGLFNGTYTTEGLNEVWNKMYKEVLGLDVPGDKEGILQDVHWSDGSFGYFPTYALGSAYGAQFLEAMKKDIDVEKALAEGHYEIPLGWLKEHIHQYGFLYDPSEIMVKATGKEFDVNLYLDYLEDKYTKLYHLS